MMQTDVKSYYMTATGSSGVGGTRTRVKAVYYVSGASAGSVLFTDGGSTGPTLIQFDTPTAANAGNGMVLIPGEGVVFSGPPYVTLTGVTSVTFFYG
jgi:hypothetical protein